MHNQVLTSRTLVSFDVRLSAAASPSSSAIAAASSSATGLLIAMPHLQHTQVLTGADAYSACSACVRRLCIVAQPLPSSHPPHMQTQALLAASHILFRNEAAGDMSDNRLSAHIHYYQAMVVLAATGARAAHWRDAVTTHAERLPDVFAGKCSWSWRIAPLALSAPTTARPERPQESRWDQHWTPLLERPDE